MANNRMQIYCLKCKGMAVFAKYWPGCWGGASEEALHQFFERHDNVCWPEATMDGLGRYAFRTEMDDDGYVSAYQIDGRDGHMVVPAPKRTG